MRWETLIRQFVIPARRPNELDGAGVTGIPVRRNKEIREMRHRQIAGRQAAGGQQFDDGREVIRHRQPPRRRYPRSYHPLLELTTLTTSSITGTSSAHQPPSPAPRRNENRTG
jgi:hypothetical protein